MKKLLTATGAALVAGPALAQTATFGDVTTNTITNMLGPMSDLILNVAWVIGLAMIMFAIFKLFKAGRGHHGEPVNGGAIAALGLGGALLVAFPSSVGIGPASIFGADANTGSINGQMRSIQ